MCNFLLIHDYFCSVTNSLLLFFKKNQINVSNSQISESDKKNSQLGVGKQIKTIQSPLITNKIIYPPQVVNTFKLLLPVSHTFFTLSNNPSNS